MENTLFEMTQDGQVFEVDRSVYLFVEFLKEMGQDVSNLDDIINVMSSFMDCWHDYQRRILEPEFENPNFTRFSLFHTIKPGTTHAHQQRKLDGKPVLYAISRIVEGRVYSTAVGGNYAVEDCDFFTRDGGQIVPLTPKPAKR